jgi:hypothetical protein
MGATNDLCDCRQLAPRATQALKFCGYLFWSNINEMPQPIIADGAVIFFGRGVKLPASSGNVFLADLVQIEADI